MKWKFFTPPKMPEVLPGGLEAEISKLRKLPTRKEVLSAYGVLSKNSAGIGSKQFRDYGKFLTSTPAIGGRKAAFCIARA